MNADFAVLFMSLLSHLNIEHPAGCPPFYARQWNNDLEKTLKSIRKTAQLAREWEILAYTYYQEGLYQLVEPDYESAQKAFFLCERYAALAQNHWLTCLAIFAQACVEIERKNYPNASLLLNTTRTSMDHLWRKLPEYGFDNRYNHCYLFLREMEALNQKTTTKLRNMLNQQTQRIYHPPIAQKQRPIDRPVIRPVCQPATPRPPIHLAEQVDLYTVIHAVDGQQILPDIQDGDWLIVHKDRLIPPTKPVFVVDCKNGNLPGPTIQVGETQLGRRNITKKYWLILGERYYRRTYRINNRVTVRSDGLNHHGLVVGIYHHLEPLKLPQSSTAIKTMPQRAGKWFSRLISNSPAPYLYDQCESPTPKEFTCLLPYHIFCVNTRFQTQFIPEIRPGDILIVELDTAKPIAPGSPIIVQGGFNGDIHVNPFPNSPKQYNVAQYIGQPRSGVIEFFVNNGEVRKTSQRIAFKGVVVGYYRRLK